MLVYQRANEIWIEYIGRRANRIVRPWIPVSIHLPRISEADGFQSSDETNQSWTPKPFARNHWMQRLRVPCWSPSSAYYTLHRVRRVSEPWTTVSADFQRFERRFHLELMQRWRGRRVLYYYDQRFRWRWHPDFFDVFKNRVNSKEIFSVISVSENSKNSEPLVVIVQ